MNATRILERSRKQGVDKIMLNPTCPFCGEVVRLPKHLKIGRSVMCSHCDEGLLVVHLNPVTLELFDDVRIAEYNGQLAASKSSKKKQQRRELPRRADGADWVTDDDDAYWKRKDQRTWKQRMLRHRESRESRYSREWEDI
jgi:uncharacterized Zn finger protein (UPF0148 family)